MAKINSIDVMSAYIVLMEQYIFHCEKAGSIY